MSIKMLISIVLGLGFLYLLFTAGMPFLLAMVTAMFLEPVVQLLMRHARLSRFVSGVAACTLYLLLILVLVYLLGQKIVTELIALGNMTPVYIDNLNGVTRSVTDEIERFFETLSPDMAAQLRIGLESGITALTEALKGLFGTISRSMLSLAKAIPEMLIFFIVYIVALYLYVFSLPRLKASSLSLFEVKSRAQVESVLNSLRDSIFGFLRAQLLISLLTYIVTLVGLLLLRVDYPLAIALLIIIVDILPVLGTGSVLVPWAIYSIVTGDVHLAIGLLILFVVITIFRRVVEPKIIGDSVGITPLATIVSLYVGFKLIGVIGLILGPIVVIIYAAMRKVGLLQFKIKLE